MFTWKITLDGSEISPVVLSYPQLKEYFMPSCYAEFDANPENALFIEIHFKFKLSFH